MEPSTLKEYLNELRLSYINKSEVANVEIKCLENSIKELDDFCYQNKFKSCTKFARNVEKLNQVEFEYKEKIFELVDSSDNVVIWFYLFLLKKAASLKSLIKDYHPHFDHSTFIEEFDMFNQMCEKTFQCFESDSDIHLLKYLSKVKQKVENFYSTKIDELLNQFIPYLNLIFLDHVATNSHLKSCERFIMLLNLKYKWLKVSVPYLDSNGKQKKLFYIVLKQFENFFKLHFDGSFKTNDITSPEFYLKKVYEWINENNYIVGLLKNAFKEFSGYYVNFLNELGYNKTCKCLASLSQKEKFLIVYYFDVVLQYYTKIHKHGFMITENPLFCVYTIENCYYLQQYFAALFEITEAKVRYFICEFGFSRVSTPLTCHEMLLPDFFLKFWDLFLHLNENIAIIINHTKNEMIKNTVHKIFLDFVENCIFNVILKEIECLLPVEDDIGWNYNSKNITELPHINYVNILFFLKTYFVKYSLKDFGILYDHENKISSIINALDKKIFMLLETSKNFILLKVKEPLKVYKSYIYYVNNDPCTQLNSQCDELVKVSKLLNFYFIHSGKYVNKSFLTELLAGFTENLQCMLVENVLNEKQLSSVFASSVMKDIKTYIIDVLDTNSFSRVTEFLQRCIEADSPE